MSIPTPNTNATTTTTSTTIPIKLWQPIVTGTLTVDQQHFLDSWHGGNLGNYLREQQRKLRRNKRNIAKGAMKANVKGGKLVELYTGRGTSGPLHQGSIEAELRHSAWQSLLGCRLDSFAYRRLGIPWDSRPIFNINNTIPMMPRLLIENESCWQYQIIQLRRYVVEKARTAPIKHVCFLWTQGIVEAIKHPILHKEKTNWPFNSASELWIQILDLIVTDQISSTPNSKVVGSASTASTASSSSNRSIQEVCRELYTYVTPLKYGPGCAPMIDTTRWIPFCSKAFEMLYQDRSLFQRYHISTLSTILSLKQSKTLTPTIDTDWCRLANSLLVLMSCGFRTSTEKSSTGKIVIWPCWKYGPPRESDVKIPITAITFDLTRINFIG